jgi:hypothetical protein
MLELKDHLSEHMSVKASMKYYFLLPGKILDNGLLFLIDDLGCKKMSDYTANGVVAEVFVEYHGEEDEEEGTEESESDYGDEIGSEEENGGTDICQACTKNSRWRQRYHEH